MTSEKTDASMAKHGAFDMFMLSNLHPSDTGVEGAVLWVSAGEYEEPASRLGPRLLIMLGDKITTAGLPDVVAVTLTDPPEVIGTLPPEIERQVIEYVNVNREVLLAHWHGELSTRETLDLIGIR